ncbi:MAG: ribonuclease III [Lachnospiraceae bacterium]|nr:ribonuclease III [Lachnospiraceae bacterium]
MEKSLKLLDQIKETFACEDVDVKTYSPLALAFIGDGIFEIIIRTVVVERGNRSADGLHKTKSRVVNAKVQAKMAEALLPELTEEEVACYKRGRNAKSHTAAKNASIAEYRKATGLEALFGYLYLVGREERILELTKLGLEKVDVTI